MPQRILIDTPADIAQPCLIDKRTKSSGHLLFEQVRLQPHTIPEITFKDHTIALTRTGSVNGTWLSGGFTAQKNVSHHPKGISIIPAGTSAQFDIKTRHEYQLIQLKPDVIARSVSDAVDIHHFEIVPGFDLQDPLIENLLSQVSRGIDENTALEQLYVESLTNALVVHLLKNYASQSIKIQAYKNGLSKYQLRIALDYIQAHLEEDIKLSDMAELLGMSQYYFCRLFRQSVGMPPYKYVIHQRIERAKQLLRQPKRMSIAAIALECGFANQSALNKHFRKLTNTTPRAYLQNL